MTHKDWTDQLRDRLADASIDAPDELWSRIEQRLDAPSDAPVTHTTITHRRRQLWWAAAAAVIVAVLTTTAVYLGNGVSKDTQTIAGIESATRQLRGQHTASTAQTPEAAATAPHSTPEATVLTADATTTMTRSTTRRAAYANNSESRMAAPYSDNLQTAAPQAAAENAKEPATAAADKPAAAAAHKSESPSTPTRGTQTVRAKKLPLPPGTGDSGTAGARSHRSHWNVGVSTEGSVGTYDVNGNIRPILHSYTDNSMALLRVNTILTEDCHEKSSHHMPMSFGLTTSYSLTDRMAVSTGLVLTRTTSDFERGTANNMQKESQTLYYIGVPLNVSYTVWGSRMLKTYVQAGAQADFNVSANLQSNNVSTDIKKDRPQFSAGASAGVQFNFVPQAGIYVEPGVRYYFDNNSSVQNIYKEHPCNFSLQIGLRYNIK